MVDRLIYEKYHKNTRLQKSIIEKHDFTYKNILNAIENYIPNRGNVLDIGSGTGSISFYFASRSLNVDGIELSSNAVRYANLNKKRFKLENVNFKNISFERYQTFKKYDFITCFEVLEHVEDDIGCLKKIFGFMRDKSFLAISVPSDSAPLFRLGFLKDFDKRVGHLRRYSELRIKSLLLKSGFDIIDCVKSEGILRNLFFTNSFFGYFIKLTKFKILNSIISNLDNIFVNLFSESQLIIICKKK